MTDDNDHETQVAEIVDEFVDEINTSRVVFEAERLGLDPTYLIERITRELKARFEVD